LCAKYFFSRPAIPSKNLEVALFVLIESKKSTLHLLKIYSEFHVSYNGRSRPKHQDDTAATAKDGIFRALFNNGELV
jgi:hypothetical protein